MGLKTAGATRVLNGGLFGSGIYIGVLDSSGSELSGGGYARIAQTSIGGWSGSNGIYRNSNALNFPTPTQVLSAPAEIGIWSAPTGGDLLLDNDLAGNPAAPAIGASFGFDAQSISIGWTGSGTKVTNNGSLAAFTSGLVGTNRWISLHSAEPSDSGSNQAGTSLAVTSSNWTISGNTARNNTVLNFGIQASNLPDIMWIALRTSSASNASVLWKDQLDNNPDDPDVGDQLTIPANGVTITVTTD